MADTSTSSRVAEETIVTAEVLARVVRQRLRVLIVGSPPGSFRERLTRHPFLLFWPSSEYNRRDGTRAIPEDIGAVLLTSVLSHELSANVRAQVRTRSLYCPMSPLSAGAISRLLNNMLALLAESPLTPPEELSMSAKPTPPVPLFPAPVPEAPPHELVELIDETVTTLSGAITNLQLIREGVLGLVAEQQTTAEERQKLQLLRDLLK